MAEISEKQVEELYLTLKKDAQQGGYYLNPDVEFVKELPKTENGAIDRQKIKTEYA